MQNPTNEKIGSARFVNDYFETMRALPDNQRKVFAAATFVIGVISVGLASWFLFPPLQDLNAPTLQNNNEMQALANLNTGINPITDETQRASTGTDAGGNSSFADTNNIPQIGPVKGFIDSFNAVKNLLVPADMQTNTPASLWQTASDKLSQWMQQIASKAEALLQYAFDQGKILFNSLVRQVLHYIPDALNRLISSISRVSQ